MLRALRPSIVLLLAVLLAAPGARPHAVQAQASTPFQGNAAGTPGPVQLHAGLVIVRGRSNGSGNFTVSLATQDPGATVSNSYSNRYLMIDAVGTYNGAAAALLTQDVVQHLPLREARLGDGRPGGEHEREAGHQEGEQPAESAYGREYVHCSPPFVQAH